MRTHPLGQVLGTPLKMGWFIAALCLINAALVVISLQLAS